VTDLHLTATNVSRIARGGRCRWRIENETFNTLKNQGYHFEHNYGHGEKNLGVVLMMLMMAAFLIDQVQQKSNDQPFQGDFRGEDYHLALSWSRWAVER
jgi:hypothetical protein